ncbi:DUF4105 domain-containing protein [Polaribacter gangjinensis]|uniref:Uncharacterized protein n=1 Tax=Polaribacter gangjinensis TaxID=574710 RepID=A0A2S7WAB6_9FLAO|nr:DUF4105 domain-containing protein [Polaribacter gangjinensis]PQJ74568.1 hypothetical protein BTO13_04520 [Polaribacter gangjinensis]
MIKKYAFLILFSLFFNSLQSQVQLSVYSEISIVTTGPGTELYEAFGHSAIRVKDPMLQLDLIYNYGMFDFNQPNFYSNFVKGKLLYTLGRYPFSTFLQSYYQDKRWVKQQVLNLTQQEKQAFFNYLENNALPQNSDYLYDPYFDNCATKLRDITSSVLKNKLHFGEENLPKNQTFRQLMNQEIPWNSWGSFGINVALGSKLDKKASVEGFMYLPKYIYSIFKNSKITNQGNSENLVKNEEILLDFKNLAPKTSLFSPFLIFLIFSIIGIYITFSDIKNQKRAKWLDVTIFSFTGIVGILIVFLWFFTNHSTTPNNFNFLWAFAPNFLIAFFLFKEKPPKWIAKYVKLLIVFLSLIPILWLLKIQEFPMAVIPLLLLFAVRFWFLTHKNLYK